MLSGSLNRGSDKSSRDSDICPICGGVEWLTRIVDGVEEAYPCKCREQNKMRRRLKFADIPEAFKDMTLATFCTSVYKRPESRQTINVACAMIVVLIFACPRRSCTILGCTLAAKSTDAWVWRNVWKDL